MQTCSGQPDRAGAAGDRDCNSNELSKRLLLLALGERQRDSTAAGSGGDQCVDCCPIAPPRTKRRSKEGDQIGLTSAVHCVGGTLDWHCTSGSQEATDGTSGNRAATCLRCLCGLPNAGASSLGGAPSGGGALASGRAPCCVVRRGVAEEALAAADGSASSCPVCTPDGSDRPSVSECRADTEKATGGVTCGLQTGSVTSREPPLSSPLLPRPPCEGCAAPEVALEAGSTAEVMKPRDVSSVPLAGEDSARAGSSTEQVVVVLRRKPQRSAADSSRRRSSRMSQHKRASGLRAGGAASAAAAAAATIAEKAASLRQKFVALKTRAKGMQQKDNEIKMKFQDLQKRRNVLKSLSRSSVVRASKLGGETTALELSASGGVTSDLV